MTPPTKSALLSAVKVALLKIKAQLHGYTATAVASCLYEVHLLGLVVEGAKRAGADLKVCDGTGQESTVLRLRRKPGRIHANDAVGFVSMASQKREFELHTDLMIKGRSGTRHEVDVGLYRAKACRGAFTTKQDPSHKATKLLIECKRYAKPLPLGIGREFVGLMRDVKFAGQKALVTCGGIAAVQSLVLQENGRVFGSLAPGQKTALREFNDWLDSALQPILG